MARHNVHDIIYGYTKAAIEGLCRSGKVDVADKIGDKAAVIAEAALKRNEKTFQEMKDKREKEGGE